MDRLYRKLQAWACGKNNLGTIKEQSRLGVALASGMGRLDLTLEQLALRQEQPGAPSQLRVKSRILNPSFGQQNQDTLVTFYIAHKFDILDHISCVYGQNNGKFSNKSKVPAIVTQVDYVHTCRLVLYVLWCHFPQKSYHKESLHINFGKSNRAHLNLGGDLIKVTPALADHTPRQFIVCMSRLFAFEKWQILVTALEVYKALKVDLVVAHITSVLTPIYELMKSYEKDGILAIRTAGRLPFTPGMSYDPNVEIEYSGQTISAHECLYEFRESAQFIALLDWDDLLITTKYSSLWKTFHNMGTKFPDASYFLVNRLESTFVKQGSDGFNLREQIKDGILSGIVHTNEKLVVRPDRVVAFWIYHSDWIYLTMPFNDGRGGKKIEFANVAKNDSVVLHYSTQIQQNITGKIESRLLSGLNFSGSVSHLNAIKTLSKNETYDDAVRNCNKYIRAMPIINLYDGCTSYDRCHFPEDKVSCVIAEGEYNTQIIQESGSYAIYIRMRSHFRISQSGCFPNHM